MRITHALIAEFLQTREKVLRRDRFSQEEVDQVLRYGASIGSRVEVHERLPRCMERMRELLLEAEQRQESLQDGAVVIAGSLEAGSGRFARPWHAPKGGLWFALALADTLLPEVGRLLPLAVGTACCEAVRSFGIDASLKWVNDVHVAGKKIAGVLTETVISPFFEERYHLVGIGVNVNNLSFPDELTDIACSIRGLSGMEVDLSEFATCLLGKLSWNIGLLKYREARMLAAGEVDGGEAVVCPVLEAWRNLTDCIGRPILYGFDVQQKPLYRATVRELNGDGGLVMELPDGRTLTEYSGEILYLDIPSFR